MLIEFSVSNYRSIKTREVLNLRASKKYSSDDLPDNKIRVEEAGLNFVVKSAVVFGGNASGKSNMLNAISALQFLVENSNKFSLDKPIRAYEPFRLDSSSKKRPVKFEIDFIAKDSIRYIYSVSFTQTKFLTEELFFFPKSEKLSRKALLFSRKFGKEIGFGTLYKGSKKIDLYENQLVLSQVSTRPIKSLVEPYRFFSTYLFCSTIHDTRYDDTIISSYSKLLSKGKSNLKSNLNKLIGAADTEIIEITTKEFDESDFKFPDEIPEEAKKAIIKKYKHRIKSIHKVYDNDKIVGQETFDISDESTGTKKLIVVGSLILDALSDGTTILIDELDKSLHPLLTQMLIKLFNSVENNPNNAQLIFASHDIALIDRELFRLDQLYFSEKDYKGVSKYFRLSDFTDISKVVPLAKWYIMGRFGALPMINEFDLSLDLKKNETQKVH